MASENESKTILELANSLTLEQVQEQMALYHRMYHKLRKEQDPEYMKGKRQGTGTLLEGGKDEPQKCNQKYTATELMIMKAQLKVERQLLTDINSYFLFFRLFFGRAGLRLPLDPPLNNLIA